MPARVSFGDVESQRPIAAVDQLDVAHRERAFQRKTSLAPDDDVHDLVLAFLAEAGGVSLSQRCLFLRLDRILVHRDRAVAVPIEAHAATVDPDEALAQ